MNKVKMVKYIKTDNMTTEDNYMKVNLSTTIRDQQENIKIYKSIAFGFDIFRTGECLVMLILVLDKEGNYKLTKTYDEVLLTTLLGEPKHYLGIDHLIEFQLDYIKKKLLDNNFKNFKNFKNFEDNDFTCLNIINQNVNTFQSRNINRALEYILKKQSLLSNALCVNNRLTQLINNACSGKIYFV